MKKYLGLFIVFTLAFGYVWGAIYYDAETNSYVYTNATDETEEQEDTEQEETEEEEEQEEDTDADTGDTADDEDEDTDVVDQVDNVGTTVNYNGPLEELHDELDDHASALQSKLKGYYEDLLDKIAEVQEIDGGVARIDVLQCLGLIDDSLNLEKEIADVYKQLKNQIGITEADIHSDISALENKIEDDLLDSLMEKLETSAAMNKVTSFNTEYDNVVDTFKALFEEYITDTDNLVEDTSQENENLLDGYDERIADYEDLEDAYDNFVQKSSFAGVIAGPNIQELYELRDALRGYYSSVLRSEWHDGAVIFVPRYAEERAQLAEVTEGLELQFSSDFDDYADELLEGLYPVEDLLLLHKSILSLRSAYTEKDGSYDCKAFATNRTIEASAPQLIDYMNNVLANLNKYVNQIADGELPTDAESLKEGLLKGLSKNTTNIINEVVRVYKDKLNVRFSDRELMMLAVGVEGQDDANEQHTRLKIQKAYLKFLKNDDLESFYDILEQANETLEEALTRDIGAGSKRTLQMIQSVIMEFY